MLHNIINDARLSLFIPTRIFNVIEFIVQYFPDITISMGGYLCEIYSNYGKCKLNSTSLSISVILFRIQHA